MRWSCVSLISIVFLCFVCKAFCDEAEKWKKKDVRDYSDADVERLFDQWEEADEDELEEDELPQWKKPQPKIDLSSINPDDPESMLRTTKKGQTLMMFVTVSGDPKEAETEQVSQLWQSSLFNANVNVQRYVVGPNRVLFLLTDGAQAWEIKDFLVDQDRCEVVTIEGKDYYGKAYSGERPNEPAPETDKQKKKKKKKAKKPKTETKNKDEL